MRFRAMSLFCECGRAASRVKRVGLTPQHQLVIHWWCFGCKRDVFLLKELSECWRDCPKADEVQEPTPWSEEPMTEPDANFLRSLGVKFPDEAEP